ncbi:MAG TPA: hypothetical protein VFU00_01485 [Gemmatimonadales bacterium]|nr:hypothetical protein [Gemmatimonadales bacterium]
MRSLRPSVTGMRAIATTMVAMAIASCSPKATPPPPPAETREIEERSARPDRDRIGPLGIPEAQLPAAGECRIWYPGRPASEQPARQPCAEAEAAARAGAWVLYRPPDDPRVVHARVLDPARKGAVLRIDLYDAEKGTYLGTKQP